MNIYEQALGNLIERNWLKERLYDNDGNRCMAGHLLYVRYGRDIFWYELPDLNDEDFSLILHTIIAEQYPDVVDRWLATRDEGILTPIGLVTYFNDYCASYSDIRAVLEKAASREA